MTIDVARIAAILDAAGTDGRTSLFEYEVYELLEAAGCRAPCWMLLETRGSGAAEHGAAEFGAASRPARTLPGDRVVLKVVARDLAHKSDVGGVATVDNNPAAIAAGAAAMLAEVAGRGVPDVRGVLVVERIAVGAAVDGAAVPPAGAEVLISLRDTREFGAVVTMGVGGVDTEALAGSLRPGVGAVSASAVLLDGAGLLDAVRPTLAYRRLAGLLRGGRPLVADEAIVEVFNSLGAVALHFGAGRGHDGGDSGLSDPGIRPPTPQQWTITELEVNPFGASAGTLVALDGLCSFAPRRDLPQARPMSSLDAMLEPRSIAIIGVSARVKNLGRIILRNILGAGFDKGRVRIVRPDTAEIDGVACVATIADLPERADLFVVAVGAEQVPAVMDQIVDGDRAVGVIVIPGGMAEKGGGEGFEAGVARAVSRARSLGQPLVVDGGNCLGIVSRPGRYDTLFIPRDKLPTPDDGRSDVALISQSGGFMITRLSKLPWLRPRYAVSTGNQVDLTVSDFVGRIARDPEIRTIAVYVEGFREGDGLALARTIRTASAEGRDIVFYKAGRTAEGRAASLGHTASIAGDHEVCEAIVRQSGALVADTFDDFLALLRISVLAGGRAWRGRRLGAISNAGFEAVAIADRLRGDGWSLEAAALAPGTRAALHEALAQGRADSLVDVRNPLDLTPMADDAVHELALRAFLDDPGVDVVLCSTVPLTDATATLPAELAAERGAGSLPARLERLLATSTIPIVASVDAGQLFDPFAAAIEARGVPVFRSVDAALRAMGLYTEARLRDRR